LLVVKPKKFIAKITITRTSNGPTCFPQVGPSYILSQIDYQVIKDLSDIGRRAGSLLAGHSKAMIILSALAAGLGNK
jgi:hypothetical protein